MHSSNLYPTQAPFNAMAQLACNWMLTSCLSHRITSGRSNIHNYTHFTTLLLRESCTHVTSTNEAHTNVETENPTTALKGFSLPSQTVGKPINLEPEPNDPAATIP